MLVIGMYADQTGIFSEDELNEDNWCEAEVPEWILRKWYDTNDLAKETAYELRKPINEVTFNDWYNEVSCGDDTDGLYIFCIKNGFIPQIKKGD